MSERRLGMVLAHHTAIPEPPLDELAAHFAVHREQLAAVNRAVNPEGMAAMELITRAAAAIRGLHPTLLELLALPPGADPIFETMLRLQAARVADGLSWHALARALGCGQRTLARWCDRGRDPPARLFLAAVFWIANRRNPTETKKTGLAGDPG